MQAERAFEDKEGPLRKGDSGVLRGPWRSESIPEGEGGHQIQKIQPGV